MMQSSGKTKPPKEKKAKRPYIRRNKTRPKRPLSAYNLFFRHERERLVRETLTGNGHADSTIEGRLNSQNKTKTGKRVHRKTHGAIGFAEMGKRISQAWKSMDEKGRAPFQAEADKEKERYQRQLSAIAQRDQLSAIAQRELDDELGNPNNGDENVVSTREDGRVRHPSEPPPERYERSYNESRVDAEGGSTEPFNYAGYNYYHPAAAASPGHYQPPAAYHDYYVYHGNDDRRPGASSSAAFVPPPDGGPASPSGYAPAHPPPRYHPPRQHPTAHAAFAPPYPTPRGDGPGGDAPHHYPPPGLSRGDDPGPPVDDWAALESRQQQHGQQRDFAFQCEVCNSAVFSTFVECAEHEEECAKKYAALNSHPGQNVRPPEGVRRSDDGGGHDRYMIEPFPNSVKADSDEQQQAVEAVMMLKKPMIEC